MKLTMIDLGFGFPDIHPASAKREWMDKTPNAFAYRCLPLNIANSVGWEIRCEESFEATWTGEQAASSIRITSLEGDGSRLPASHFGSGTITFMLNVVFVTEENYNLYVTGVPNLFKHGIQPLSGLIETYWLPYSFTMNWKFTAPGTIRFDKGEPFCFLFPVQKALSDQTEPVTDHIENYPDIKRHIDNWVQVRNDLQEKINNKDPDVDPKRLPMYYYKGMLPDGSVGCPHHQIKNRLKPFK